MWLYYDTETTGMAHAFDQIQQIAAVLTSKKWREFEALDIKCRLSDYVIPSPEALIITRQRPADLTNEKLDSHYDMMTRYHNFLNQRMISQKNRGGDINGYVRERPITFKGHNILSFDEAAIRHNSHITLHNPYIYMMDGCARFDTMICAQALAIYGSGSFLFPETAKGNTSFRLGALGETNNISVDAASLHDALVDVRLTIEIDKAMAKAEPELYYQMDLMAAKEDVRRFVEKHKVFSYSLFNMGKPKTGCFTGIVNNRDSSRRSDSTQVMWDLSIDPEAYFDMDVEDLAALFSKAKRGNGAKMNSKTKPSPIIWMKRSEQPMVMPMNLVKDELYPKERLTGEVMADEDLESRADKIAANKEFQKKLNDAYEIAVEGTHYDRAPYSQEWLYEGFPDSSIKAWMTKFHKSSWTDRMELVEGFNTRFEKQITANSSYLRYKLFAKQLIIDHAPDFDIAARPGWMTQKKKMLKQRAAAKLSNAQYTPKGMDKSDNKVTLPAARLQMQKIYDAVKSPVDEKQQESLQKKYGYDDTSKLKMLGFIRQWIKWYDDEINIAKNVAGLNDNKPTQKNKLYDPADKRRKRGFKLG